CAGDVDDVLQRVGNPVHQAAPLAGGDLGLGGPGLIEGRLVRDLDVGVVDAVEFGDAGEQSLRELDRREPAGPDEPPGLRHGHEGEVGHSGTGKAAGSKPPGMKVTAGSVIGETVAGNVVMHWPARTTAAATVAGNSAWARSSPRAATRRRRHSASGLSGFAS